TQITPDRQNAANISLPNSLILLSKTSGSTPIQPNRAKDLSKPNPTRQVPFGPAPAVNSDLHPTHTTVNTGRPIFSDLF
ncbi:hypothetical protein JUN65_15530, partial [Gluconacetobacter azotocaptans]|uniref:hypothetical protein n=1 Tax=Gluconacetobacter azotocaptans TaxID=142834 RepID=UPI0019592F41